MYPNNPHDIIANFIVFPMEKGWELYLHEDMARYGKVIERCLAVTETLSQMIEFLDAKLDGLHGQDILLQLNDNESDNLIPTYLWIIPQPDGCFALFEDLGSQGRKFLDEDFDIDDLVERNKDNNIIISF
jgi:hypothetical protein